MTKNEKTIILFITTKDISEEAGENHYVVNGIENLFTIIDILRFTGNEAIYVHLNEPITFEIISRELSRICKCLIENGHVNIAQFSRMGTPVDGGNFCTTLNDKNMLTNDRFMISYY